jgi:hypothetical protein
MVQDIASNFDKIITSSNNKVRFRLSSSGATKPLSTDKSHITPLWQVSSQVLPAPDRQHARKKRADAIAHRVEHDPGAAGCIGKAMGSRHASESGRSAQQPPYHRSDPWRIVETLYTPPTLVIGGLTLFKAAVCVQAVRTTCSSTSIRGLIIMVIVCPRS